MKDDRPDRAGAPLKLRAESAEDLRVIAACLQDAVVPVVDAEYLAAEKRFVMVANRFRWEAAGHGSGGDADATPFERVLCGVTFDDVTAVRARNVDRRQPGGFLNLLTIDARAAAAVVEVDLTFSNGASIRLVADRLICRLEDFDEAWPTQWRPRHDDDAPPAAES